MADYPEWVPRAVCELHADAHTSPNAQWRDTLERLAQPPAHYRDDVHKLWTALAQHTGQPWQDDDASVHRRYVLVADLLRAGPSQWDTTTTPTRNNQRHQMAAQARAVAHWLAGTPYDGPALAYLAQIGAHGSDERIHEFGELMHVHVRHPDYASMSRALRVLAATIEHTEPDPPLLGKPSQAEVMRLYYVRELARYVRGAYRAPLHTVVARTAAVILDDDQISAEYVRQATRANVSPIR